MAVCEIGMRIGQNTGIKNVSGTVDIQPFYCVYLRMRSQFRVHT